MLCLVGIAVLAYVIFFWKPREIVIELAAPQVETQVSKPQQPPKPMPRPKPLPAESTTFEPTEQPGQPIFRPLQAQPKPAQHRPVVARPKVYEWEATYNAAMDETDRSKRQERIDAAQTAINRRIVELNAGDDSPEERQTIRNAQLGLNLLKEQNEQISSKQ